MVVLSVPALAMVLALVAVMMTALVKKVLTSTHKPVVKPLWSRFIWHNEVVNGVFESVAAPAMEPLMGTPLVVPCLRAMGCKIGKWCFIESTLFSEFDLVQIGDYAALNLGATIQTHLFEDRVFKSDYLAIGTGCTIGNMGTVLYGTQMQNGSKLGPLSVLMKGEILPPLTEWHGLPCERVVTFEMREAA
jgi:non-ribosomal peptide synthetase-like protein